MNQDQHVLLETDFGVKVTFCTAGLNNCSWIHCYSIYRIPAPPIQKPRFWDTLRVPRAYPKDTCESTVVLFSHPVMSDSLWPHGLQHARLHCPSLSSRACSNSCPLSWWCHTTILSSVPFSTCLQSFPASESFLMSRLFASGIGASAGSTVALLFYLRKCESTFCILLFIYEHLCVYIWNVYIWNVSN